MNVGERSVEAADRRLRVLVSSSPGELLEEREAAGAAVRTLRLTPVTSEPGADHPDVVQSDVFVGIYWESYGWIPPEGTTSATEDEYHRCADRPRLVYLKEPAPERDPELERLVEGMRAGGPAAGRTFATPGELAELLIDDLASLVSERFYGGRTPLHDLPEGTVSFLFVDIDGSTPIVRLLGDAYPDQVLEPFRAIVTDAVTGHRGALVDFDGDGAFCAFSTPGAAARAGIAVQRGLAAHTWPDQVVVRARVGLHTGAAQRTPDGYAGLEVHRAARIGAAANGGQILVSSSSAAILEANALDGWSLVDLGSFALKGLDRAEPLAQLVTAGSEQELPAPRARGISSVKLPTHLTRLVGRETEIDDIVSRLEHHEVRLVTLTGPGGIGKSRLGVAAAARGAGAYPDGVFFVPLADTTAPDQVVSTIAETLGVRGEGARPLLDTIEDRLSTGRVLLVLDNFEQVVDARRVVADLLGGSPGTDVLVTSRIPLRLRGEYEYAVAPLGVPAPGADAAAAQESDAVKLFFERALAMQPTWIPSETETADVADICRRLDGLPLAIELAASRLRVLDTASLLDRLSKRLDVVGGSIPDLPDRQRTLTATIDWSHELLDGAERMLLRRLAIFVGGWTVEATEAVCRDEGLEDVLGGLERLVEHSLVVSDQGPRGPRMRMLETIREYATARLEESGEAEEVRRRHASYFDRFVRDLRPLFSGTRAAEAMHLLDADWENINSVVVPWRVASRDFTALVELASATWRYVWLYDRVRDSTTWMAAAYEARAELEPSLRGELSRLWGSSLYQFGEYARSKAALEEAVELLAEWGPLDREAWARTILAGLLPHFEPDLTRALDEIRRAIEIFRADDNDFGLATALGISGTIRTLLGRTEQGMEHLDEGLAASERVGLPSLIGANRSLRALASLTAGDATEAREYLEEAAEMPLYLEGTAFCLEGFAAVALAEGDPVRAATALGAAEGLRARTGIEMWPVVRMAFEPAMEALDVAGPEVEAARYEGRRMNPRDVFAQLARAGAPR